MLEVIKMRISLLQHLLELLDDFSENFKTVEKQYGLNSDIFTSDEILESIKLLCDDFFGIFTETKEILNYTYKPKAWITEVNLIKFCAEFYQYLEDIGSINSKDLPYFQEVLQDITISTKTEYFYVKEIIQEIINGYLDDISDE